MKAVIILAVLFAVASADYFKTHMTIKNVSKWTKGQHIKSEWLSLEDFDVRYELAYGVALGYQIELRPTKGTELKNITMTGTFITLNKDDKRHDGAHFSVSFNKKYHGPSQWIDGTLFSRASSIIGGFYDRETDTIKVDNYVKYTVDGVDGQKNHFDFPIVFNIE
jgi:hypothetical protein